jgi:transposase-like protein
MKNGRRQHSAALKAKVALEAARGLKTTNELAALYEVHPTQIAVWKKRMLEEAAGIFSDRRARGEAEGAALQGRLYEEIGRLKMELDWLKKKAGLEDG